MGRRSLDVAFGHGPHRPDCSGMGLFCLALAGWFAGLVFRGLRPHLLALALENGAEVFPTHHAARLPLYVARWAGTCTAGKGTHSLSWRRLVPSGGRLGH